MTDDRPHIGSDIMSSRTRMILFYALPVGAILASGNLGSAKIVSIVWPLAFLVMGLSCVANARRCGRVHCFFTGPVFPFLIRRDEARSGRLPS